MLENSLNSHGAFVESDFEIAESLSWPRRLNGRISNGTPLIVASREF